MKVFLSGYVKKNLGDDLFFKIILEKFPNVTFLTTDDAIYLNKYKNLKFYKSRKKINILERFLYKLLSIISKGKINYEYHIINSCDCAVRIGGSLFIENEFSAKYKYFTKINIPFFIIGSNFGPYNSDFFYNKCLTLFNKSSGVTFRDSYSYNLFKKKINCRLFPDLIFCMATNDEDTKIYANKQKKIVFSVIDCSNRFSKEKTERYENNLIKLINKLSKEDYEITLMSFCKIEGDEVAIERIYSNLNNRHNIKKFYYDGNISEALKIIKECDSIFATRFHANILGFAFKKNVIPLIYSDKTKNMLSDMNFLGKTYDIRKDNFDDIINVKEEDLKYTYDLRNIPCESEKHFYFFDEWLRNMK